MDRDWPVVHRRFALRRRMRRQGFVGRTDRVVSSVFRTLDWAERRPVLA